MQTRLLLIGAVLWVVGTLAIRLAGQRVLQPGKPGQIALLYAVSFLLMAWLVRRICRRTGLDREAWPGAASLIALPTLLLDPFSCLFVTSVFPNLAPGGAGLFGGWMLICCAGALTGVRVPKQ